MFIAVCQLVQTRQGEWEEGSTVRVTVPVGGADPDGLVRVPVMVVNVPAGGVAGFAEAVTPTVAGCKPQEAACHLQLS